MYLIRKSTMEDLREIIDIRGYYTAIDLDCMPWFYSLLESERLLSFACIRKYEDHGVLEYLEREDLNLEEEQFFLKGIVYQLQLIELPLYTEIELHASIPLLEGEKPWRIDEERLLQHDCTHCISKSE
ncbi:MAG: hypothetical protein Q4G61_09385 [Tissierellia bacterium]|nr:hypothetical protein [Tissierellia bacterium]